MTGKSSIGLGTRLFWSNRLFLMPSSETLLTMDGDHRIIPGNDGYNAYGCPPRPEPDVFNFASSTASAISVEAAEAVEKYRAYIARTVVKRPPSEVYAGEMERLRKELLDLCGLGTKDEIDVLFAPSGTDLHRILSALMFSSDDGDPISALTVDSAETGSGVYNALLEPRLNNSNGDLKDGIEVTTLALRDASGDPRPSQEVDAEAEWYVSRAISRGYRVLIVMVDVSKTGLIAPSLASVLSWFQRWPDRVSVIVDACQFRLSPETLQSYLAQGFNIFLTGSKFLGGPAFSGAALLPRSNKTDLRQTLRGNIESCAVRGDFPTDWPGLECLAEESRFGLLLRWKAALHELGVFRQLPVSCLNATVKSLAKIMEERFEQDPALVSLQSSPLERQAFSLGELWDNHFTIFPFLVRGIRGNQFRFLNREQTRTVYGMLPEDLANQSDWADLPGEIAGFRCRVGQPIDCGQRDGVDVSALRLAFGARLLVEASLSRIGFLQVVEGAMRCLDKCILLSSAVSVL